MIPETHTLLKVLSIYAREKAKGHILPPLRCSHRRYLRVQLTAEAVGWRRPPTSHPATQLRRPATVSQWKGGKDSPLLVVNSNARTDP